MDIGDIQINEGQALRWFAESEVGSMAEEAFAFGFRAVILDFFREGPFAEERVHET